MAGPEGTGSSLSLAQGKALTSSLPPGLCRTRLPFSTTAPSRNKLHIPTTRTPPSIAGWVRLLSPPPWTTPNSYSWAVSFHHTSSHRSSYLPPNPFPYTQLGWGLPLITGPPLSTAGPAPLLTAGFLPWKPGSLAFQVSALFLLTDQSACYNLHPLLSSLHLP